MGRRGRWEEAACGQGLKILSESSKLWLLPKRPCCDWKSRGGGYFKFRGYFPCEKGAGKPIVTLTDKKNRLIFLTFFYCCSNTVVSISPLLSPHPSHHHFPPYNRLLRTSVDLKTTLTL